jgi:pimeloyl-ACP methyl ester carboxylesterase
VDRDRWLAGEPNEQEEKEPMNKVTSSDGKKIAFDRSGDGQPAIVVGGQLCDRALTRPTAEELAKHFTVFNYDRRGRGDSGDTAPYTIEREIEDLGALIAEAGGRASVYGHSSGAGLALHAAAHGPLLGGLLLEFFWWGSVFLLSIPIMLVLLAAAPVMALLVLGPVLLPEFRDPEAGRLDLPSAILSLAGVLVVIYGLKRIAEDGLGPLPAPPSC